jgi:hypothetical protein
MAPLSREKLLLQLPSLPTQALRASAAVDFLQFFAGTKPALRSVLTTQAEATALRTWCQRAAYDFAIDADFYFCVAPFAGQAQTILDLDRQPEHHEYELGRALGYPSCCCRQIARLTEASIDTYAASIASWKFVGDYSLINPTGYITGDSLLSHLPCSPYCLPSLMLAKQTYTFLVQHTAELRSLLAHNRYLLPE